METSCNLCLKGDLSPFQDGDLKEIGWSDVE